MASLDTAAVDSELFPYLLVNIGSGVSIIRVDGPGEGQFSRVSGSSVGGGTFWGLCKLLTGVRDFDDMLELSTQGNNSNVSVWLVFDSASYRTGVLGDCGSSSIGVGHSRVCARCTLL
eukprot:GHRR01033987.1.p1 GENE.GHRR01033987.1~~GHRR01033987.1.p1  ORF type:complete len:118 (+),score=25.20 GHRR01033987.1:353-706(+)